MRFKDVEPGHWMPMSAEGAFCLVDSLTCPTCGIPQECAMHEFKSYGWWRDSISWTHNPDLEVAAFTTRDDAIEAFRKRFGID